MPLGYKEMASQNMGAETEEIPEIRVKAAFNGWVGSASYNWWLNIKKGLME